MMAEAKSYALSLSGGGVRSMLFSLGALRAVIQAVENTNIARTDPKTFDHISDIASVSGGSIAVAFTFSRLDAADPTLTTDEFDTEVLGPAYSMLTSRSIMWSSWPFRIVVIIVLSLLAGAAGMLVPRPLIGVFGAPVAVTLLLTWRTFVYFAKGFRWRREILFGFTVSLVAGFCMGASAALAREYNFFLWHRLIAMTALLLLFVVVVRFRGWALEQGMIRTILPEGGPNPKLSEIRSKVNLAITATDLTLGEAIFLTPRDIISGYGEADPGDVSLIRAVRASATFPGVFPALFLPPRDFCRDGILNEHVPKRIALVDGGVYDNMGTEWLITHTPSRARLVVVNASSNLAPKFTGFDSFGLGELSVLSRNQGIQYDASTAPRRRWLVAMFKTARLTGIINRNSRKGMIVRIDGALNDWLTKFATGQDDPAMPGIKPRAVAILDQIITANPPNTCWGALAKANSRVGTSLDRVPVEDAKRLIQLGYLTTSVQLHVLENTQAPENVKLETLLSDIFVGTGPTDAGRDE